jgi:tRNA U34 5-carboxymethylaminomethyl modifying GTPase MnmE/TrmE
MGRKEIAGILDEISKLIAEHEQKSDWSEADEQKYKRTIARKLRQLLKALFELRNEAERQKKLMSPEALEKLD